MMNRMVNGSASHGVWRWVHRNFLDGWLNVLLSALGIWLLATIIPGVWRWVWTDSQVAPADYTECRASGGACWAFLQAKWRLILFGTYPYNEQWRPSVSIVLFIGTVIGSCFPSIWTHGGRRVAMLGVWSLVLIAVIVLMRGGVLGLTLVEHRLWAGLPLTLGLASVGCVSAFLAGVLLALGRRSNMPILRWMCVGYVEFFQGVPLVALLFLATVLFPLIVPPEFDVDKLVRVQLFFAMFYAAYMAEAIRGGLQAIPDGQYAAAQALGLGYWRTNHYIALPQALRLALPSLVNIVISAFKDTSLVVVVSMMDILGTTVAAIGDPAWSGLYIESYLFVALIYFVFCVGMSWYSGRLESHLARRA
jgi:general L-amino acid transport system permease protein